MSSFTAANMQGVEATGSRRLPGIAGHSARRQIDSEQVAVSSSGYGPGVLVRDRRSA